MTKHWSETIPCAVCGKTGREGKHATDFGEGHDFVPTRTMVCEECGNRVFVIYGKYATHGIRHPEDSPTCEASGTEPD